MKDDVFRGCGIEVTLKERRDFLKVMETLTRMGRSFAAEKRFLQVCHILHKRGRYAIMHYKEMRVMDGEDVELTNKDIARRNTIAFLLQKYKLVELVDKAEREIDVSVLPYGEKKNWRLESKYTVGERRRHLRNDEEPPEIEEDDEDEV